MEMDRTSLICISTVLGSDNFYSKLLMLKDEHNRPFFNTFEFFLACQACIDAGIAAKCVHKMHELPHWQSSRKHDRIRHMMKDQQSLLERETLGLMQDAGQSIFSRPKVKAIFTKPAYVFTKPIHHIFVSIDPNAGGDSRFAICSCVYESGRLIIIGLDAKAAKYPAQYESLLLEHLEQIRKNEFCKGATLVIMPESNLGFESHHIQRCVMRSRHARYSVVMTDKDNQPGLCTTHPIKEAMAIKLNDYLVEDAVFVGEHFVCVNDCISVRQIKRELCDELCEYKEMTELAKTPFQAAKKTYTGKIGGLVDDLAVCLQLNALWHLDFFKAADKYSSFY